VIDTHDDTVHDVLQFFGTSDLFVRREFVVVPQRNDEDKIEKREQDNTEDDDEDDDDETTFCCPRAMFEKEE
jgi:hypothetical protein